MFLFRPLDIIKMVKLHVKRGDQSQFLFETSVKEPVHTLVKDLVKIYNGRLKIDRLFYGINLFHKI